MQFDIITIFPEIFDFYFKHSILKRAKEKKILKVKVHNLRDFTKDKRKTVDDKPFGGGRGMVMKIEPIYQCVSKITKTRAKNKKKARVILFSPRGKKFNQKMAVKFSKYDKVILLCGRYEAIDERVAKHIADEVISIGDYVFMGGELASLIFIESVARLLPGVIGKSDLLKQRITKDKGFIEYPQYTRPEVFVVPSSKKKLSVPKVLLSGDHKKIKEWRKKHSKVIA